MPQEKKKVEDYVFGGGSPTPSPSQAPKRVDDYVFGGQQAPKNPDNYIPGGKTIDPTITTPFGFSVPLSIAQPITEYIAPKVAPVLDVLSRGQYASAAFFDATADDSKTFFNSVSDAFNELLPQGWAYSPQTKMSFSDVIKKRAPEFAKLNPITTEIVGFIGDVALDPTSYLGVGLGKTGIKVGGKVLTKTGEEALEKGITSTAKKVFVGERGTLELVEALSKEAGREVKPAIRAVSEKLTPELRAARKQAYEDLKTKLPEDVLETNLFLRLEPEVQKIGKPGFTKDIDSPDKIIFTQRNADGEVDGILRIDFGISRPDTPERFYLAATEDAQKIGVGTRMLNKASKQLGFVLDEIPGVANYPEVALRIAKANIRREFAAPTKQVQVGTKGGMRQHILAPLVNQLESQGYFQAVKERTNEINNLIKQVTGTTDDVAALNISKSEILNDLKRVDSDTLMSGEVRNRVENRILNIVNLSPSVSQDIFAKGGVYVKAGLPFGKQYDLFRIAGTEHIAPTIKALNQQLVSAGKFGQALGKVEDTVAGAFNRNQLGQLTADEAMTAKLNEYIRQRDEIENYLGYAQDATVRDTIKLFNNIDSEGKKRIGSAMQEIDDATRLLEEQVRRPLTNNESSEVILNNLKVNRLTPEEQASVALLYQDYKDMALAEMRAKLLTHNLVNYSPRGYNAILDEGDMTTITRGKYREQGGPNPYLSSSQERKYMTNAEAKAAGLDLEMDAAILYANRALASRRALSIKQFKDSVEELFGTYTSNPKYAETGILPTGLVKGSTIPKRVIDDMRMIGESVIPSGLSDSTKSILKAIDKIQAPFKFAATRARPTFAMRQLPSNTIQGALVLGARAFKAFDPRSAVDASLLLFRNKETKQLPQFLNNFINKFFGQSDAVLAERTVLSHITGEERLQDLASQWSMRNPFGEHITGVEMVEEMRRNGIKREFDASGEGFSRRLNQELDKSNSNPAVVKELSKFWKHAAMVEDYNRAVLYINGRRLGHSPEETTKLVNKALFDYQRGLSNFEKQAIRRLVLFYSFQRFAIPYVIKQTIKQPGNYLAIQKFIDTTEKLISSGESLNPAEREAIPGFLLEQPTLYSGFDKDGKATFNILNNLTPYDVLNLMVYDKNGNVDYGRSAEKAFFGAITPFIKVPLEAKYDYNIFTQKTIEEASKLGDLSTSVSRVLPDAVKNLISWEDRTDLRTGKTTTYMNPYLAYYSMNFFPFLRDYIKPLDGVTSPLEGAMGIVWNNLNPIKQTKVDLKAQQEYELLKTSKEIKDIVNELRNATIKGSNLKVDKSQKALQLMMETMQKNAELATQYEVRGKGLGVVQEGQEGTVQNPAPTIAQPMNRP